MNILYFSPIKIYPIGHGNCATVHQQISRLRKLGHSVHYVYLKDPQVSDTDVFCAQRFVDTLDVIASKSNPVRNEQGYYLFDSFYFDGLGEALRDYVIKYDARMIICSYAVYSKAFDFLPAGIIKIIDTHDRLTDRHISLRLHSIRDEFYSCTQDDERMYLSRAQIIWARTEADALYFNSLLPLKNNAITIPHFNVPNFINREIKTPTAFGIIASNNQVNFKSIRDFIDSFSLVYLRKKIDVKIVIAGRIMDLFDKKEIQYIHSFLPIEFVGYVPSVYDFYSKVDVILVPIEFGTGINIKMVEALAYGVPVISTTIGMRGISSDSIYHQAKNFRELVLLIYRIKSSLEEFKALYFYCRDMYSRFYSVYSNYFDDFFRFIESNDNHHNLI